MNSYVITVPHAAWLACRPAASGRAGFDSAMISGVSGALSFIWPSPAWIYSLIQDSGLSCSPHAAEES
jgi:hypothetical protein